MSTLQAAAKHFLDLTEIPAAELKAILRQAHALKADKFHPPQLLKGQSLAMIFDKRSTRTRMSFEVAMKQLGGHTVVMSMGDIQLSDAENIEDTAQVMSRYVDAVMARISDHDLLKNLSQHSAVPIINGLTDWSHPCQIMADLMTIEEKLGALKGKKLAWFGDYNNVTRSLAQAAEIWDFSLSCAMPEAIIPTGEGFGPAVRFTADAAEAAQGADVVLTDTWVSMGQEGKTTELFWEYQVNDALMAKAADHAIFMHCMPIHRGEEVANSVLATPQSVIYDEAENRLHAQKAILCWCLQDSNVEV